MNILPAFQSGHRSWPVVCCAWCGEDLNANNNLGLWDVRQHFAACALFLISEAGRYWAYTEEGKQWRSRAADQKDPTP